LDKFYQIFPISPMKYGVFPGSLTRVYHPGIFSELLNTGETLGQKVAPPSSFAPKLSLQLVRPSFANVHLMKAIFANAWAVAVVMG
jgi:hypothetical protein